MTKKNWIEQEYADILAEIPDLLTGIRDVVNERMKKGDYEGAARWMAAAELLEVSRTQIKNRFTPRPSAN